MTVTEAILSAKAIPGVAKFGEISFIYIFNFRGGVRGCIVLTKSGLYYEHNSKVRKLPDYLHSLYILRHS